MRLRGALPLAFLLLAGCGTVIHRADQPVFVDSRPPGATATVVCGGGIRVSGTTPARLAIPRRGRACQLRVESPGYETARLELDRQFSGGFWGNFGVMGALGLGVLLAEPSDASLPAAWGASAIGAGGFLIDRLTGRAWSHDPEEIIIDLERIRD
ncbi:MAG TPA: hypothetical protein VNA04_10210 [Thermoanaerobaculia bacterium]|nr:hypothetical protein [Thermoanaerobaculia bacterium]